VTLPGDAPSIIQVIRSHAVHQPDKTALILLAAGEEETGRLTYGELDRRARSLAGRLQSAGLPGERVLLPMPTCLEYAVGMLGCLYARAIPVPVYPPGNRRHAERLSGIVADCAARLALTTTAKLDALRARFDQLASESAGFDLWAVDQPADDDPAWTEPEFAAADVAYLQYTSGSTAEPRGVMITHGSLMSQVALFSEGFGLSGQDMNVSWLPLFHDFGVVAGLLNPLYLGATTVLMPPVSFAQRPVRWLNAISRYRGNTSWGPNFALELCCQRVDEQDRAGLDLSCWR